MLGIIADWGMLIPYLRRLFYVADGMSTYDVVRIRDRDCHVDTLVDDFRLWAHYQQDNDSFANRRGEMRVVEARSSP